VNFFGRLLWDGQILNLIVSSVVSDLSDEYLIGNMSFNSHIQSQTSTQDNSPTSNSIGGNSSALSPPPNFSSVSAKLDSNSNTMGGNNPFGEQYFANYGHLDSTEAISQNQSNPDHFR
jgi:hypothetical protein